MTLKKVFYLLISLAYFGRRPRRCAFPKKFAHHSSKIQQNATRNSDSERNFEASMLRYPSVNHRMCHLRHPIVRSPPH